MFLQWEHKGKVMNRQKAIVEEMLARVGVQVNGPEPVGHPGQR